MAFSLTQAACLVDQPARVRTRIRFTDIRALPCSDPACCNWGYRQWHRMQLGMPPILHGIGCTFALREATCGTKREKKLHGMVHLRVLLHLLMLLFQYFWMEKVS